MLLDVVETIVLNIINSVLMSSVDEAHACGPRTFLTYVAEEGESIADVECFIAG